MVRFMTLANLLQMSSIHMLLNGSPIIEDWGPTVTGATITQSVTWYLSAGTHDFEIWFYEDTGSAVMQFEFAGPNYSLHDSPGGGALPDGGGQNVALFTSPLFHVSGCHSTLVVGLLAGLKLVMPEGQLERHSRRGID